jgi:hypothetical protein
MKTGSRSQPPATVDCDSRCLAHLAGLNSVAWGTLSRPRSSRIRPANQMDTSRNDRNLLAAQRPDSEATVRRVVVASLSRRFRAFSTPLASPSTRCWSDPRPVGLNRCRDFSAGCTAPRSERSSKATSRDGQNDQWEPTSAAGADGADRVDVGVPRNVGAPARPIRECGHRRVDEHGLSR